MPYLIVFTGGGLGAVCRFAINQLAVRCCVAGVPVTTLVINVVGSFLMGVITEYFGQRAGLSLNLRLFLTTGVLGGFTTFSAFSLEAMLLAQQGATLYALMYVAGSVLLSLLAVVLGVLLVSYFYPTT